MLDDPSASRPVAMLQILKTWIPRLVLAAAVVFVLYNQLDALKLFYNHARSVLDFPYPIDYGEGPLLDQVARLAIFQNLYQNDISNPPYTITNYPPVYPLVQVPFYWIFGPELWYGRIISLLGVFTAAVFIGLTVYSLSGSIAGGILSATLLPIFPFVLHWAPLTRVDSLALGLSWAGIFILVRWGNQRRGIIWAAVFLVAAIFTRQSYGLAAPLAGFVYLLREVPRKRAFYFAGYTAVFGFIVFLILMLLSKGGFFFHIVTANVNPFDWDTVTRYRLELTENLPYIMFGGAAFIVSGILSRPKIWWLGVPYLIGATVSAVTIGKDGSNVNYLYELSAALCLTTGAIIAWPGRRHLLSALLVLLLIPQINLMVDWSLSDHYNRAMGKIRFKAEIFRMAVLIEETGGPALADEYMAMLPLGNLPIVYQPFEYKMLQEAGVWDETPFIRSIENKEFALILLYDPPFWDSRGARWTPAMLEAIETHYQRGSRIAETTVYRPKQ
jgi:hypothetical protein